MSLTPRGEAFVVSSAVCRSSRSSATVEETVETIGNPAAMQIKIGSVATGLLYEQSRVALVAFAVTAQLISLPLFVIANRQEPSRR